MIEKLRFKCPVCGMCSDVDQLNRTFNIKVWIQKFGGKVAGNFKGRGKAKGLMKYVDVTKSRGDIVEEIREKVNEIRS